MVPKPILQFAFLAERGQTVGSEFLCQLCFIFQPTVGAEVSFCDCATPRARLPIRAPNALASHDDHRTGHSW
jgi:hypothetical protein